MNSNNKWSEILGNWFETVLPLSFHLSHSFPRCIICNPKRQLITALLSAFIGAVIAVPATWTYTRTDIYRNWQTDKHRERERERESSFLYFHSFAHCFIARTRWLTVNSKRTTAIHFTLTSPIDIRYWLGRNSLLLLLFRHLLWWLLLP